MCADIYTVGLALQTSDLERGTQQAPGSPQDAVLHPQQRLHGRGGLAVEGRDVDDAQRRILTSCCTQRLGELLFVGVGDRLSQDPVPQSTRGQHIGQGLQRVSVIADQNPRAGLRDRRGR